MVIDIETVDPHSGFEVCIYPQESRRKRASWILWISADGSGQLFMNREEDGAVIGEPIRLPANASRKKKVVQIGRGFFDEKTAKEIKDFETSLTKTQKCLTEDGQVDLTDSKPTKRKQHRR